MRSFNAPRCAAHDAGMEVSGSAVSVPRVEPPTKGQPIAAPISVAPIPGFCRGVYELPIEGTAGASQKLLRCRRTDAQPGRSNDRRQVAGARAEAQRQ